MINYLKRQHRLSQTKFSFGVTSAIITNLGLITGMDTLTHPKLSIIGAILAIALADNIADSLGIHIFQESECIGSKEVWISTLTNFLSRLLISLTFIALVGALPIKLAVIFSVIWGLMLLVIMSYTIAKARGSNPYSVIVEHLTIAVFVVIASHIFGKFIISKFKGRLV